MNKIEYYDYLPKEAVQIRTKVFVEEQGFKEEFDGKVEYIVDGGETKIGIESTVVKVIDGIPTILRPGKITPVYKKQEHSEAYEIDIGFPTSNIIMAFNIENNENYSIYYNWQSKLTDNEYVLRLNDDGEWEKELQKIIEIQ